MSKEEKQQQMFEFVEQWNDSGISQKEFSQNHNLKISTFGYWVKRHKEAIENKGVMDSFVELAPWNNGLGILIRYANGTELTLPVQTPLKTIKYLLTL